MTMSIKMGWQRGYCAVLLEELERFVIDEIICPRLRCDFSRWQCVCSSLGQDRGIRWGSAGTVVIDGKAHAQKGLKCSGCHKDPKLFEKSAGYDKITMADINSSKFCGVCHDGTKSFKASDQANCDNCHKK